MSWRGRAALGFVPTALAVTISPARSCFGFTVVVNTARSALNEKKPARGRSS